MSPEQAGTKSYPSEGEDVIIFAVFRYEIPLSKPQEYHLLQ
jgi:hypothetical protein